MLRQDQLAVIRQKCIVALDGGAERYQDVVSRHLWLHDVLAILSSRKYYAYALQVLLMAPDSRKWLLLKPLEDQETPTLLFIADLLK